MSLALLKKPSGWLPVAMSGAALALVVVHVARYGMAREADEGTSAHLFQLLMVAQVPVVFFFASKWLPKTPKQAMWVLGVQAVAAMMAFAAVYVLERGS